MGKKLETKFKEKVVKRFWEEFGPEAYVLKIQQVALRGIPDLFIIIRGHIFVWELKSYETEKASPLQEQVMKAIRIAGGTTAVVHPGNFEQNLRDVKSAVNWLT